MGCGGRTGGQADRRFDLSAGADMTMGLQTARDRSRRWLLIFASSATVFSVLHHVDHVTRGNHSGWPSRPRSRHSRSAC